MRTRGLLRLLALAAAIALVPLGVRLALGEDLQREQEQGLNVLRQVFAREGQVNLAGVRVTGLPQPRARLVQRIVRAPGHKYRIEFLGKKRVPTRLLISDGVTRWLYDRQGAWAMSTQAADAELIARRRAEWVGRVPDAFVVRYFGIRSLLGRRAHVVQLVRRRPPRTYRKYWVDADQWVPLLRQHFAPDGTPLGEERYLEVSFPSEAPPDELFAFEPPRGTRVSREPTPVFRSADVAEVAKRLDFHLAPPQWLPEDFFLQDACLLRFRGHPVAWLRYTDIFSFVSVFERQGTGGGGTRGLPTTPMVVVRERGPLWIVVVGSLPQSLLEQVADSAQP